MQPPEPPTAAFAGLAGSVLQLYGLLDREFHQNCLRCAKTNSPSDISLDSQWLAGALAGQASEIAGIADASVIPSVFDYRPKNGNLSKPSATNTTTLLQQKARYALSLCRQLPAYCKTTVATERPFPILWLRITGSERSKQRKRPATLSVPDKAVTHTRSSKLNCANTWPLRTCVLEWTPLAFGTGAAAAGMGVADGLQGQSCVTCSAQCSSESGYLRKSICTRD
eukprot:2666639-Amphidinium_carterae.1